MEKYFKKKGIPFMGYTSIFDFDEKTKKNVDLLQEQLDELQNPFDDYEMDDNKKIIFDDGIEETKEKKSKFLEPEYIFVFDDLSTELQSKSVVSLLKKNRHFKCKTIISSQYLNDLRPESRKQIDLWLIFKGLKEDKLQEIFRDADPDVSFDVFMQLYKNATKEKYSFFYVDCRNSIYRRNFSDQYDIKEIEEEEK